MTSDAASSMKPARGLACKLPVGIFSSALLGLLLGCQGNVFSPGSLPPEFRVPPTANVARVDLSRLAVPGESSEVIGPGDVLELTISTGYEPRGVQSLLVRVDDNGQASIPLVGGVNVGGLMPAEAEQTIAAAAVQRAVYRQPHVTVLLKRRQMQRITVVGAVEKPGVVELPRGGGDLLGALASAGGMNEQASTRLRVMRKADDSTPSGGPRFEDLDLNQLEQLNAQQLRLRDGDVVMVFEEEPRLVHVMGLVNNARSVEIPVGQDLRLLDALAKAGGRTLQLADTVRIVRQVPGLPEPVVIEVSVTEAKQAGNANMVLAANDVITVEETPLTFVLGLMQGIVRVGVNGSTPIF